MPPEAVPDAGGEGQPAPAAHVHAAAASAASRIRLNSPRYEVGESPRGLPRGNERLAVEARNRVLGGNDDLVLHVSPVLAASCRTVKSVSDDVPVRGAEVNVPPAATAVIPSRVNVRSRLGFELERDHVARLAVTVALNYVAGVLIDFSEQACDPA